MCRGNAASRCLVSLVLCLSCLVGCRQLPGHRARPLDPVVIPDQPAGGVPASPAPPLRIPGPPVAAAPTPTKTAIESPPLLGSAPPPPAAVAGSATPNPPLPAAPAAPTALPLSPLRRLAQQAAATYAALDGYTGRLRQREQVNGKDRPEEVMLVKFRKQPWSVYFQWAGPEAKGREVVFVQGRGDGKIHTRLAAGDVPLMPAGATFAVAPDSLLARGRSRHPITEASLGTTVDRFRVVVDAAERGSGGLTYLGTQTRPEFVAPLEVAEQTIPPGLEAPLPRGGRRQWFFSPDSHLPVLISTRDETGHEVEYYCYDQLQFAAPLTDKDFDPDSLWGRR